MKSNVIAAVALAVCAMGLGAPAALAQEDGSTQPTSTTSPAPSETTSPEEEPTEEPTEDPEPTTEPEDPSDEVTLAINPTVARPGQRITATATCDDPDGVILFSEVLGAVILTRDPDGHQPWALRGTTKVSEDARPGEYDVYAECDAGAAVTTITVLPNRGGDGNGGGKDDQQVSRTPKGAPETGSGPDGIDPLAALLGAGGLAGLVGIGFAGWRAARR